MLPAFLTTLLFSISGVTAKRSTQYLPSVDANFWRLSLATLFLGLYAHMNTFVQLVLRASDREHEVKRWPPRAGDRSLI